MKEANGEKDKKREDEDGDGRKHTVLSSTHGTGMYAHRKEGNSSCWPSPIDSNRTELHIASVSGSWSCAFFLVTSYHLWTTCRNL